MFHRATTRLLPALIAISVPLAAQAADFHVSPTGRDGNPGTAAAPFQTLAAARDAARKVAGREPVTVHVANGVYYLAETLVFTPADSGTEGNPISYRAANEGGAVISGGQRLELRWKPGAEGIHQAATPPGLVIDQLFVNGSRQRMARYPNYDPNKLTAAYQGFAADAISKERAARWADPAGGFIHAMHVSRWGGYHYRITGKKPDGNVAFEGGWQNNRQMGMHRDFRMVENIFEELDAPGEWFHNARTATLYFKPEPGTDLAKATVEVVRLPHLVDFQGTAKSPVRFISLQGFTFRHAARTFMETREPLLRSDWTIYRGGAVLLTGTEHIAIRDCEFDQVGGNAVFFNHYNRGGLVKGCHLHDAGASGVCFVGNPAAVRNPLFEYGKTQDPTKIDRTPGPLTDDYPADCAVEDCLIRGIGRVERQPAGVQISMSSQISVRDCSIYDCARAGINISEGTWGGHLIERCDVFDTVLETHDHGSFNSWGRDRYWSGNHRGVSEPEVKRDPRLPFLDAIKTTVIRDSRWRCDHGWDIDLDDGSSNYEIYNNLLLAGGLKFREGYGRKAFNNILINNGFHPHVWFDDCASEFRGNIVMKAHAPIGQPAGWGKQIDHNLFTSAADRTRHLESGADVHSLAGDPRFIAPEAGDFRVADGSPALQLGFRNFPMDQFGVKKPVLKALAKTPAIPELKLGTAAPDPARDVRKSYWLGALLHGLEGEEFSAFGVSREDGGVQLANVPGTSAAAQAGLKSNDLIQAFNGRKVRRTSELLGLAAAAGNAPVSLKVVRSQMVRELVLPSTLPYLLVEGSDDPAGFVKLPLRSGTRGVLSASTKPANEPLATLTDGKLAMDYGPVFENGTTGGAYKLDLGASRSITTISSWSFNQNGNRGPQMVTIYGSNQATDPGWKIDDSTRFEALGTIDTGAVGTRFVAAALRARDGGELGRFRFIVWSVSAVTAAMEHTAFQELAAESKP